MMRLPMMLGILLLAACGSVSSSQSSRSAATSGPALQAVQKSSLGQQALSDQNGHTLYYFMPEADGTIHCTGSCTSIWPPLTYTGTEPSLPSSFTGAEGSITRPDGSKQVTYSGWPLYTYSPDSSSNDANGQGVQGKWFAVTMSIPAASGSGSSGSSSSASSSSSSSASSGGSGGGSYNYN